MPYCPLCLALASADQSRCALDGAILCRWNCPQCAGEVGPQHRYCGHCRHDFQSEPALRRWVDLRTAPLWRQLASLLFDGLTAWVLASFLVSQSQPALWLFFLVLGVLVICPVLAGRPSLGQQVFSLRQKRPFQRVYWLPR